VSHAGFSRGAPDNTGCSERKRGRHADNASIPESPKGDTAITSLAQ
jgi:hypothetical protein